MSKEEERLNRLQRRCDWLEARIAKAKARGQDTGFDVAEASALRWAIERITTSHDELWAQNRKLQRRIYNQRKLIQYLLTRQHTEAPTEEEVEALIDSQETESEDAPQDPTRRNTNN